MSEQKPQTADTIEAVFEVRAKGGTLRLKYAGALSKLAGWCETVVAELGINDNGSSDAAKSETLKEQPAGGLGRVAAELGLPAEAITGANIFGIKGDDVQLYGASSRWSITDAACVLLWLYEKALDRKALSYDAFKAALASSGIKTESPAHMVAANLKTGGYLSAAPYDQRREVALSPKGDQKAVRAMKTAVRGNAQSSRASPVRKAPREAATRVGRQPRKK